MSLSFYNPESASAEPSATAREHDRAAASLGRAVHRALEWVGHAGSPTSIEDLAAAAAAEFGVEAAVVERHVRAVLGHADGKRFFTGSHIRWSGNEVAVSVAGEVRRIDRLVHIDEGEGAVWWVLDYKLRHDPQALAPYRQQLLGYRDAVRVAQPGHPVRCAFITGDGRVVEIA